jgi:hypothetical protein
VIPPPRRGRNVNARNARRGGRGKDTQDSTFNSSGAPLRTQPPQESWEDRTARLAKEREAAAKLNTAKMQEYFLARCALTRATMLRDKEIADHNLDILDEDYEQAKILESKLKKAFEEQEVVARKKYLESQKYVRDYDRAMDYLKKSDQFAGCLFRNLKEVTPEFEDALQKMGRDVEMWRKWFADRSEYKEKSATILYDPCGRVLHTPASYSSSYIELKDQDGYCGYPTSGFFETPVGRLMMGTYNDSVVESLPAAPERLPGTRKRGTRHQLVGRQFPDFEFKQMSDGKGCRLSAIAGRGKKTVVGFFSAELN